MFSKVNMKNLGEVVYDAIKEKIISNELKPDEKLDMEQLCKQLGVSRTPVINALHALERDGYVYIRPRSGTYVNGLTCDELDFIFDLREAIEAVIVRKSAAKYDRHQLTVFRGRFLEFAGNLCGAEALNHYFDLEVEFHEYLISFCVPVAYNDIQNMIDLTKRARKANLENIASSVHNGNSQDSEIQIHISIIDNFLDGNLEGAISLLRQDIRETKGSILSIMAQE